MLEEVRVENLAIADSLNVRFEPGFNVITGETGAGKSVIVGAVALIAGERASSEMVRSGCPYLTVEGFFSAGKPGLASLLDFMGLKDDPEGLVLKRQVYPDARTRAFVNGSLATVSGLREIGGVLLDIHGQHEHQSLISRDNHILFLDEFAGLAEKRSGIPAQRQKLAGLLEKDAERSRRLAELAEKREYMEYQLKEIDSANLRAGEEESLDEERHILGNADRLSSSLEAIHQLLYESEDSILVKLSKAIKELATVSAHVQKAREQEESLRQAEVHVQTVADELSRLRKTVESNPARLEEIEERLHLVSRLRAKHKCSVIELIGRAETLRNDLALLSGDDGSGATLSDAIRKSGDELAALCSHLRKKRAAASSGLEKRMKEELSSLDMKSTRFEVLMESVDEAGSGIALDGKETKVWDTGADRIEFMVSPNSGEDLKPLSKIASGGEISRIMLALRSILRRENEVETVVFDEIDSGIGGKAARTVGEKLKNLGKKVQVICVTHLPIIASQADAHYLVEKKNSDGRTIVTVKKLNGEDRIREIARMLAGDRATGTTLRQAKELLVSEGSGN